MMDCTHLALAALGTPKSDCAVKCRCHVLFTFKVSMETLQVRSDTLYLSYFLGKITFEI